MISVQRQDRDVVPKLVGLSASTPVYGGKANENVEEWMFIINQNLKLTNLVNEKDKLAAITNFVRGSPLKTLRNYLGSNNNPSVREFFALLLRLVPEEAKAEHIKNSLLDLRQGENFFEFLTKFQTLATQLSVKDPLWSEKNTIFAFKRALKPKVRFELEKADWLIKAEEAYDMASRFEKCMRNNLPKKKEECHKVNTFRSASKESINEDRKLSHGYEKRLIKCFRCQKLGHVARDCQEEQTEMYENKKPWVREGVSNLAIKRSVSSTHEVDVGTSHRINMIGTGDVCTIAGQIYGIDTLVVLDTGASVSIMSDKWAKENNVELIEVNVDLKGVNGQRVSVVGETSELPVLIEEHVSKMKFIVARDVEYDTILGIDWFRKTNAGIFPKDSEIVFKRCEEDNVPLEILLTKTVDDIDIFDVEFSNEAEVISSLLLETKRSDKKRLRVHTDDDMPEETYKGTVVGVDNFSFYNRQNEDHAMSKILGDSSGR